MTGDAQVLLPVDPTNEVKIPWVPEGEQDMPAPSLTGSAQDDPRPVPLGIYWLVGGHVAQPMKASVEVGKRCFVATQPETGIFGVGGSFPAAIHDLRAALLEHFETLTNQSLSEGLQEQLRILRLHLRP